MIYRIVTEDKGDHWTQAVEILVSKSFDGFSISKQVGYYKGQKEKSIVIEINQTDDALGKVWILCEKIRDTLNQECVLLQTIASNSNFI